jgi:ABC-type branched-subunit amino acid transport system ATPase component
VIDATTALTADGLTRRFGDLVAVNDLTFEVAAGGVVGFVGPNGSGKPRRSACSSIVAPGAGSYLPGGTLNTLAAGGNNQLSWGAALGLAVLYGLIAATVSLLTFRTRDIIS